MAASCFRANPGSRLRLACLLALSAAPLYGQAEPAQPARRPDPLNAQASVPAASYSSSLKRDTRPAADGPISWREANDTVTRIGGWRVYAREANPAAPATVPAPTADTPVPPAPPHLHGGHKPASGPQP